MSPELQRLIERSRGRRMTPHEAFEQRVSFIYGQQDSDRPGWSKDQIREHLRSQGMGPLP